MMLTRRADDMEETLTIVCKHDMQPVATDNGLGRYCTKCRVFMSDDWWSPQVVVVEAVRCG